MKKHKIKIFFISLLLLQGVFIVNAIDTKNELTTSSKNSGSVIFSHEGKKTNYYNKDNNSDIVGNYLSGSYFSTLYGYFDFENVRFVGSTSKCQNSYGYKLSGKAYSENIGYIDFAYNDNTFVYYCMGDNKLYGKAYIETIGEQIFDGISFNIVPNMQKPTGLNQDNVFVNDTTIIFENNPEYTGYKIGEEQLFYIWKPKK